MDMLRSTLACFGLLFVCISGASGDKPLSIKAISFNTGLIESTALRVGLPVSRAERRDAIIDALKTTDADLVCLQEAWMGEDVEEIVNGVSSVYPFSFSKIHQPNGSVNGYPDASDGPLCDALTFQVVLACLGRNGCDVTADPLACGREHCDADIKTAFTSSTEDCLACFIATFPVVPAFMEGCAGFTQTPPPTLKKMNAPGLLLLAKEKLTGPRYTDYFPSTVEMLTRGYLAAKTAGNLDVVCTHLSAALGTYIEYNLEEQFKFTTYAEQNLYEVGLLKTAFGSRQRLLLLGDFNTGPAAPGGIVPYNAQSYLALGDTFTPAPFDLCTYCPQPENVFNRPDENYILDHFFGIGVDITNVQKILPTSESPLVVNGDKIPLSDHEAIQATVTKLQRRRRRRYRGY